MTAPLVLVNRDHPSVTILTLNRPEKRNALNIALLEELCRLFEETEKLAGQRIAIIAGAGSIFCAGLDLKEAVASELVEQSAALLARLLSALYSSSLVTIAAVQGAAIAGGAGLASACDFIIAAKGTQFGYPEVRRGLVAAQVAVLLQRQLPMRKVRELLLLGESIDAEEALEIGLINCVAASEQLIDKALEIASVALKGAPQAIVETKRLLTALESVPLADQLKIAMETHHRARLSSEAKEGVAAFFKSDSLT